MSIVQISCKEEKKALIKNAVHGVALTKDEKNILDWLINTDMYTVENICNVFDKLRQV